MTANKNRTIVVTGATGLQGSAVVRHLLANGWRVCALTRSPSGVKAQQLSLQGAKVIQGNMDDPASLLPVFEGAYGVFSVQNPILSGFEGEVRQGKNVADAVRQAGVQHLVYSSTGTGARDTGIPSWESKLIIEDYMKSLGLPLTILRPTAFMELMTEKKFYPAVSTWQIMPKLMGSATKIGWMCTDDIGFIAAKVFAEPDQFIGKELKLASDVLSIDECREIYRSVMGREPSRFPMPLWVFERFGYIGKDLPTMWRWLREANHVFDTLSTQAVHPNALRVQEWLEKQNAAVMRGTGTPA